MSTNTFFCRNSENTVLKIVLTCLISFGLAVQILGFLFFTDGSAYSTNISLWLMLPSLFSFFIYRVITKKFFSTLASKLLLLFLSYVLIYALTLSSDLSDVRGWLKICLYILLYVYAIFFVMSSSEKVFDWLALALVFTTAFFAWATLFNTFVIEGGSFAYRAVRLTELGIWGLANLKNALVSALYYGAISIAALFYLFRVKSNSIKSLILISFVGLGLYVFFTYSRSVWMALFFAYFIFFSIQYGNVKKYLALFLFVFLLFYIVVALGVFPGLEISLTYRDLIWKEWFSRLSSFWFLGEGPGAEFNVCIDIVGRNCFNQAHNLYMQMTYELGVIGLLLFLLLVFSLTVEGVKSLSSPYMSLGFSWLVYSLLAGLSSYHTVLTRPSVYWIVMWIPVGVIIYSIARNNKLIPKFKD